MSPPRRRPVPQAPSTQRGPAARAPSNPYDEATLHEVPAAPDLFEQPEHRPTPYSLPGISEAGFESPPAAGGATDTLGAETVMTPSGGAARRAWRDVADAGAPREAPRYGGSALDESSYGVLDAATDPELSSEDEIEATRPVPVSDDPTELGDRPVPPSVRAARPAPRLPSFPEAPPPPASNTRPQAAGPHGTKKLPAHEAARPGARPAPARRRPDTRTRSLESLGEGDEPPNEATRLGQLAAPDPFTRAPPPPPRGEPRRRMPPAAFSEPLVSAPVRNPPPGPVPQSETVAAPGELAGLIEDLEARAQPKVVTRARPEARGRRPAAAEGPPPPPDAAPSETLGGTPSMVRRGLEAPLPNVVGADTGEVRPAPEATPPPASLDFDAAPLDETSEALDPLDPPQLQPLEVTRAFLDAYDDGQLSMPGDEVLGPVEVPPLNPRHDTGPMPSPGRHAATSPLPPEPSAPAAEGEIQRTVATRPRRLLSTLLDGLLVFGVISVPALLGLFGDAVAEASPIEPDDVSRLLMQGDLTIPLVAGLALGVLYVFVTTAFGGRSLGKLAFGLQIICTKTGEPPSKGRAAARAAAAGFGALLAGFGLFLPLVDRHRRALHDKLSGTTVVRVE